MLERSGLYGLAIGASGEASFDLEASELKVSFFNCWAIKKQLPLCDEYIACYT